MHDHEKKKNNKRPFWLSGPLPLAGLGLCAAVLVGVLLPHVRADHAGNGDADARDVIVLAVTDEMVEAARAFLATLGSGPGGIETAVGYDRRALLALDYDDEARTNYVYWPYLRKGLPLDFMSAEQRLLVHDLLNTALSAQGYLTAMQIMQLERILADTETTGFPRGTENYTLAIFGEPSSDGLWGWRFEGHHLSLNFTVAPGELSVTPSFFGASPAQQRVGTLAGLRVLRPLHDLGRALVNALDEAGRAQAIADGNPPFDILSGTLNRPREQWDDWKDLPEEGLALASLDDAGKALAHRLVEEVVAAYRPEIAQSYLEQIDIDTLRFVWYGGTGADDPHYWRLDGPDFFFEYDLVQGNGNHVHAVWRSKEGDFGGDLLMQHRQSAH